MGSLGDAVRGFADTYTDDAGTLSMRLGTVATVTAGGAADGHAAVSVTVLGSTTPAPYLAAYTPTVGDLVAVLLVDGSPLILGHVIGLPSF